MLFARSLPSSPRSVGPGGVLGCHFQVRGAQENFASISTDVLPSMLAGDPGDVAPLPSRQ